MRALVVDDEPVARRVLREELETFADVEVIGEADNGEAALRLIVRERPDVVFLDLQMPIMSGFETISKLSGSELPAVVILTAYDEYAIRAFEAGAIDYLLKPVSQQRLSRSIDRVRHVLREPGRAVKELVRLQETVLPSQGQQHAPKPQKVIGRHGSEFFLLHVDEVLAFQAEGDITWVITAKRKYQATQNLRSLEERFGTTTFRRIHRGALINVNHIQKLSMLTSQRWLVTLSNGTQLTVSKRQAKLVRDVIGL